MRNLFILAVGLGIPLLFLLDGMYQLASVITLQFAYYGACKYFKHERIKIGDSSYYLGFMLTLLALFVSFTPSINAEFSFNANEILGNFGIAVASTIVGIFLRIIEVQYSSVSNEDVTQANADITETLRNFAARIKVVEKDFTDSSKTIVSIFEESLNQIRKEGDDYLKLAKTRDMELKKDLEHQRTVIQSSIVDMVNAMQKRSLDYFSDISKKIDEEVTALYKDSNRTVDTKIDEFYKVLEDYRKNSDGLFQFFSTIGESGKNIEKFTIQLAGHANDIKRTIDDSRKQHEQHAVNINAFNASVSKINEEGRSITKVFDNLNRTVDTLKLSIEEISDNTKELDKLIKVNSQQEKRLSDLTKIRDSAVAVNTDLSSAVVESASKLIKALS